MPVPGPEKTPNELSQDQLLSKTGNYIADRGDRPLWGRGKGRRVVGGFSTSVVR